MCLKLKHGNDEFPLLKGQLPFFLYEALKQWSLNAEPNIKKSKLGKVNGLMENKQMI